MRKYGVCMGCAMKAASGYPHELLLPDRIVGQFPFQAQGVLHNAVFEFGGVPYHALPGDVIIPPVFGQALFQDLAPAAAGAAEGAVGILVAKGVVGAVVDADLLLGGIFEAPFADFAIGVSDLGVDFFPGADQFAAFLGG